MARQKRGPHGRFVPTHGRVHTPEFNTWMSMLQRCHNPDNPAYDRYGGRGIMVCDEWREDFAAFFAHIGPKPSPQHSVDRIDNDRGYEPGNVRWATPSEQASNRRPFVVKASRRLTVGGELMSVRQLARRIGMATSTIYKRLDNLGWSVDEVVATAPMAQFRASTATGASAQFLRRA